MTDPARLPPKVSVILPVYNGARFLREAIDSVLAQSFAGYELVIVNDGSQDDSEDVIRPYLSRPDVKYASQPNQGVAAARNAGICLASGELLALIDQDDLWLPDKLARQVRYMDLHPQVGLLHTLVGFVDGVSRAMEDRGRGWVAACEGWCTDQLLAGNPVAPLTAMFRRSCIEAVGMFDQRCAPADDWDLWLRISRHAQLGFLQEVTGLYRYHDANESRNVLKMKLAEVRVIEGFLSRCPETITGREREVAQKKLLKFYDRARRLLLDAGRAGEAAVLRRKAFRLRLAATLGPRRLLELMTPFSRRRRDAQLPAKEGGRDRPPGA